MRNSLRLILACTLFAPLAASAGSAAGNLAVSASVQPSCTVGTSTAVAFTNYDPTTGANRDGQGAITFTCTKKQALTIALSDGANSAADGTTGAPAGRKMKSTTTSDFIAYDLYSDAGRTKRWGSATGETVTAVGAGKGGQSLDVFGQILDVTTNDPAAATDYSDTVTVTVTY